MADGAHKVKADIEKKNLAKNFFRASKNGFRARYSLPKGQAVKLIFFAPWFYMQNVI